MLHDVSRKVSDRAVSNPFGSQRIVLFIVRFRAHIVPEIHRLGVLIGVRSPIPNNIVDLTYLKILLLGVHLENRFLHLPS